MSESNKPIWSVSLSKRGAEKGEAGKYVNVIAQWPKKGNQLYDNTNLDKEFVALVLSTAGVPDADAMANTVCGKLFDTWNAATKTTSKGQYAVIYKANTDAADDGAFSL